MNIVPTKYVNGDEDITESLRRWFKEKINFNDDFRERNIEDLLDKSTSYNEKNWNSYFVERIKKGETYLRPDPTWPDWQEFNEKHISDINVKDVIENIRKTFDIIFILEGAIEVINENKRLPIFVKNSLCHDNLFGGGIETSRGMQVITQKLIPNPILVGKFKSIENSIRYQNKQIELIINMRDNYDQLINSIELTIEIMEMLLNRNRTISRDDLIHSQFQNLKEIMVKNVYNDRNELENVIIGMRKIREIRNKKCKKLERVIRDKGYRIPTIFQN